MLRAQQMARQQQIGQPQQNIQQQFPLNGGMQPMQQPFDPSHPSQMSPNFPPNAQLQRLQALHQARNNNSANGSVNPLLQALNVNGSNPGLMSRQLELMGLAHGQQSQNGPVNHLVSRLNPQPLHNPSLNLSGQQMPQQSGLFPLTPQASHASPIPPNAQAGPSGMLSQQQMSIPGIDTSGPSNVKQLLAT